MEVSYEKGVATHLGPESCAGARKDAGEALTGESAGEVLSPEILKTLGSRRHSVLVEGNMDGTANREVPLSPRGLRPSARVEAYRAGIGRAHHWPRQMASRSAPAIQGAPR